MNFDWYSILGFAIVVVNLVKSGFRGFSREFLVLSGAFLGLTLGLSFYPGLVDFLQAVIGRESVWFVPLGFLMVFLPLIFLFGWLGKQFRKVFTRLDLAWVDSLLGLGVGIVKGIIWVIVVTLIIIQIGFLAGWEVRIYHSQFFTQVTRPALTILYDWIVQLPNSSFLAEIIEAGIRGGR